MILTFKETADQKVYVTSDWHYNHQQEFVWKSRGFSSVEAHNKAIIDNCNKYVRENDILFNLGDLILNSTIVQFEELLSQIKCQNMYMLFGNHANRHYKEIYIPLVKERLGRNYTPDAELYPIRYRNVIYIGHYAEIRVNKQYAILSHYPLYSWNYIRKNSYMLHGHEHSGVKNHLPEGTDNKILDLSWDYFKKPVSFVEIQEIMNKKKITGYGHH